METGLRHGLHFCFSGTTPIFLDLETNRYFALPSPVATAFRSLCEDGASGLPASASEALRKARLFGVPHGQSRPRQTSVEAPDAELLRDRPVGILQTARAALHLLAARRLLRRGSLARLVTTIDQEKRQARMKQDVPSERLRAIVSAHGAMTSCFSAPDMCLPNSAALTRALTANGIPARLVIGVRTPPFAAHCWVQTGTLLLNDRLDVVRIFTPILSV